MRTNVDSGILDYAGKPATYAAISRPEGRQQAELRAAPSGERYDVCMPTGNPLTARAMINELSHTWNEATKLNGYQAALKISKATMAGELYIQQVEAAKNRFISSASRISKNYVQSGKYTSEHVAQILDARVILKKELSAVQPAMSFFRTTIVEYALDSDKITNKVTRDLNALQNLKGRALDNLSRNAVKRGSSFVNYADNVSIKVNKDLALKLGKVGKIVTALEFLPAAAVLLSSDNEIEQKKAMAQLGGKFLGTTVETIIATGGPLLCVSIGVATAGSGFVACGLLAIAAGIYLGQEVEDLMTVVLRPE